MKIETMAVGPIMTNCYLLGDEETRQAAYIDPGDSGDYLALRAEQENWQVCGGVTLIWTRVSSISTTHWSTMIIGMRIAKLDATSMFTLLRQKPVNGRCQC